MVLVAIVTSEIKMARLGKIMNVAVLRRRSLMRPSMKRPVRPM
jgi:hypothetical protein